MTDTLTQHTQKDSTTAQSNGVVGAAEPKKVEYIAERLYTFLEEKEKKEKKELPPGILKLINDLEIAGVFFHVIDGVVYINGKIIDSIENIKLILEGIKDFVEGVQKIYLPEEAGVIYDEYPYFVSIPKLSDADLTKIRHDVEVDLVNEEIVKNNKEYFAEQNSYTNNIDSVMTQQALLSAAGVSDATLIDKSKAELVSSVNNNIAKKNKQIVFKIGGKIVPWQQVVQVFQNQSIDSISQNIVFGANFMQELNNCWGGGYKSRRYKKIFCSIICNSAI